MITIKNDTTISTDVCTNRKRLLHCCSTCRTVLAGEMGRDCNHMDVVHITIVLQPTDERSPSCIMDRFSEFAVAYHVPDLKVFIGNQVVRSDIRVCRLSGKILTLPLNFQMLRGQSLSGFLSVRRLLLFTGEASLQTFELVFSFTVVTGVLNGSTFRIGQVRFQADINSQLLASWNMLNFALGFDAKLDRVSICSPDNANSLDKALAPF